MANNVPNPPLWWYEPRIPELLARARAEQLNMDTFKAWLLHYASQAESKWPDQVQYQQWWTEFQVFERYCKHENNPLIEYIT